MKARRIPLGLLYIATLILVIATIPLARLAGHQQPWEGHRQSTGPAISLRHAKI